MQCKLRVAVFIFLKIHALTYKQQYHDFHYVNREAKRKQNNY